MVYDVAIIGVGITGAMIARELSRYTARICFIDKEADVAMGASKANSGIIHAGYDAAPGTLKAQFNVSGNWMMSRITEELGVDFKRIGSLVLAFDASGMEKIEKLYAQGIKNGVPEMHIIDGTRVKEMEPNISDAVIGALFAPTAGVISPYELTIAATENAVENGAELFLSHAVIGISCEDGIYSIHTDKGDIKSRFVVNAAGVYADMIAKMLGENDYDILPRKGEYVLFDKNQGNQVHSVIFQIPTEMGKGTLVTPTVDQNLLIGPNAQDVEDKADMATTAQGLEEIIREARKSVPAFNQKEVITSFASLRAVSSTGDFVIRASHINKGFVHAGGIQSPGLSASPKIAEYVVEILKSEGLRLEENESFNPNRKPIQRFSQMTQEQKNAAINKDAKYGNVICRCETVTEGEIVEAIRRPAGARNLDAVKRRTRAGMGRCQGGFCTPRVMEILSRELGIPMDSITKKGCDSVMLAGKTKGKGV